MNEYKQIAEELWGLLDSIDTLPDMIHPNNSEGHEKTWRMMVKRAEKRHRLLKSDGYTLVRSRMNKKCEKCSSSITRKEAKRIASSVDGEVYLCADCVRKGIVFTAF